MITKITRSASGLHIGDVVESTVEGRGIIEETYVGPPLQVLVIWDHDVYYSKILSRNIQMPTEE